MKKKFEIFCDKKLYWFLLFVVLFGKFWLINRTNWYINPDTYYDSHLQINQAVSLISGNWVGSYSKVALCKNLGYPIFLAVIYLLHISYPLAFFLLISLVSYLFVSAFNPICKNKWIKLFVFTIMLYNPVCLEFGYPYRNALLSWIVIGVISSIVGIYLRIIQNKNITLYALTGFIFSGFFWILREDSVWMLPFIVFACGIIVLSIIFNKKVVNKKLNVILTLMPIIGIVFTVLSISLINYKVYGIFSTNDRVTTYSSKVLGQLILIDDGTDMDNDVWVSEKSIELAKKASPEFKKLNLDAFNMWPRYGDYSIWALRDSMANSGFYIDAKSTNNEYKKIYLELQDAFKSGKLKKKKGFKVSDTSGIYSFNELIKTFDISLKVTLNHINYQYRSFGFENIVNSDAKANIFVFENIIGDTVLRNEPNNENDSFYNLQVENLSRSLRHNYKLNNIINSFYHYSGYVLFIIALLSNIYLLYLIIKKDKLVPYKLEIFLIMIGVLLTTYLQGYMVTLWALSFGVTEKSLTIYEYTFPQYILLCAYEMIGVIFICNLIKSKRRIEKDEK